MTKDFLYYLEPWYSKTADINMRQYVIFFEPRKFYTADIKRFTVVYSGFVEMDHRDHIGKPDLPIREGENASGKSLFSALY